MINDYFLTGRNMRIDNIYVLYIFQYSLFSISVCCIRHMSGYDYLVFGSAIIDREI